MKRPIAIWINVGFRLIVAFAYFLLGMYVAFFSEFELGTNFGVPTIVLFGLLFMAYGLFRMWRAYAYFNSTEEDDEEVKNISLALFIGLSFSQCATDKKETPTDSATVGGITLGVDESFEPLMKAEKTAFEEQYKYAKITYKFSPENEVIADMLNDKIRGVVVTRDLTAKEKEIFTRKAVTYRSFNIAADGIAPLVNKSNTDTLITLADLRDLIVGTSSKYTLVVDKANSSNLKFLVDKLKISGSEKLHVVAAGSNPEVINEVKKDSRAIGIVGSNWISDGDNPTSLGFIRSVNVMSVSEGKGMPYTQPFGYNLALKKYPLRREIKYILKEAHQGLGTGFLNYVSGDLGQLIVLKAGLIPLTRPITIRTYQINQ